MPDETGSQPPAIRAYKGRTSTGINGLDLALEGGFFPGSSILVIGSATSGMDRFARQFWSISLETRNLYLLDGYHEEGMIYARPLPAAEIFRIKEGKGLIIDSLSTLIMKDGIDPVLTGVISCREAVQAAHEHAFTLFTGDCMLPIMRSFSSASVMSSSNFMKRSGVMRLSGF